MKRPDGLRAALYHRFHWLWPILSNPLGRGAVRVFIWGFWLAYFGFIVLVLSLRYVVFPHIEDYRPAIERRLGEELKREVRIGRIEASWEGVHPDLTLHDVDVADAEGRPALSFSRVGMVLSWWSVPEATPLLRSLWIDRPELHLRRDGDGQLFIAGIQLDPGSGNGNISSWVLRPRHIRIQGATLVWQDEMRGAPPLMLEDVNIALDNRGKTHQFGLTALPPKEFASRIDVRGDFRGENLEALHEWSGQAYAEIPYADLAVWRQWVDYPVMLPQGRGALRSWLDFADGALHEATVDVSLQDVSLKLGQDLPQLELEQLSGRLQARLQARSLAVKGRNVSLTARTGEPDERRRAAPIRIEPVDFDIAGSPESGGEVVAAGSASVSRLDIGALARLADYLPVDEKARELLRDYAPQGLVSELSARWKTQAGALRSYSLKTHFQNLGIKAKDAVPGFTGLSGSMEADENSGLIALASEQSTIDLPSVFSESLTKLDSLKVQARWNIGKEGLSVALSKAEFANPEMAGSAQGSYRAVEAGPGIIDMTAELTRADARAVWRYLPNTIGVGARHWLRDSLLGGKATEAKLILKGDLNDFPFLDKELGQFLVTVKARDAIIDYAKGWPRIDDIDGDLRFEGNGMEIDAHQGRVLGAKLSKTFVSVPDFDKPISTLHVKGQADGSTSEFLKFIEQSPVAEQIDHFTEDMRATGNGRLDISLTIPLAEQLLKDSKINGTYSLFNNDVTVDTALPPLRQANGSIRFSGSDLNIPGINATLLGGPLKIQGGLQKNGRVLITADGRMDMDQLRKQSDHPLLANLSGSASYHGEVLVNKRDADLKIESTLSGLSSAFPAPFAKQAGETLPLRFEKKKLLPADGSDKADAPAREQINVSLGDVMSAQLVRQKSPQAGFTIEKGVVAIGRAPQLPEKGVMLAVGAKQLDLDVWQKLLDTASAGNSQENASSSSFTPDLISLQAGEVLMRGLRFQDVDLLASATPKSWRIKLNSQQAAGDILWNEEGRDGNGRLVMRLSRLRIDDFTPATNATPGEPMQKLPALDIIADDFSVRKLLFGRLELRARNENGAWNLSRFQASNPYGNFVGSGQWRRTDGQNRSQLDFKIDSDDVGKLLGRMGYPGTVRAGTAQLEGKLAWNGPPTEIDYASMNGNLSVEASKGQFLKLDPGAAGKLLGLISLQNLPRRISLDFKDVFSEGFAFDSIAGKVAVQQGVMHTDQLLVSGPSARVIMRGDVDLKQETQHLNVNVLPEVGETAALGVAIINPVAGAATWLANKVLQNPLSSMFGFNYLITGKWDDPKVEKLPSKGLGGTTESTLGQ